MCGDLRHKLYRSRSLRRTGIAHVDKFPIRLSRRALHAIRWYPKMRPGGVCRIEKACSTTAFVKAQKSGLRDLAGCGKTSWAACFRVYPFTPRSHAPVIASDENFWRAPTLLGLGRTPNAANPIDNPHTFRLPSRCPSMPVGLVEICPSGAAPPALIYSRSSAESCGCPLGSR